MDGPARSVPGTFADEGDASVCSSMSSTFSCTTSEMRSPINNITSTMARSRGLSITDKKSCARRDRAHGKAALGTDPQIVQFQDCGIYVVTFFDK